MNDDILDDQDQHDKVAHQMIPPLIDFDSSSGSSNKPIMNAKDKFQSTEDCIESISLARHSSDQSSRKNGTSTIASQARPSLYENAFDYPIESSNKLDSLLFPSGDQKSPYDFLVDNEEDEKIDAPLQHPLNKHQHQYDEPVIDEEIQGAATVGQGGKNDSDIEAGARTQKEEKLNNKRAAAGGGAVVYLLSSEEDEWPEAHEVQQVSQLLGPKADRSSKSTVFAEDDHHIMSSQGNIMLSDAFQHVQFRHLQSNPAYQSLDAGLIQKDFHHPQRQASLQNWFANSQDVFGESQRAFLIHKQGNSNQNQEFQVQQCLLNQEQHFISSLLDENTKLEEPINLDEVESLLAELDQVAQNSTVQKMAASMGQGDRSQKSRYFLDSSEAGNHHHNHQQTITSNILHPEDSPNEDEFYDFFESKPPPTLAIPDEPDQEAIILQRGNLSNNNKASSVLMLDDVEDDDIVNQNSSRGEHLSSENSVREEEPRKEIEQPNEDAATIQAKILAERIKQMRQGGGGPTTMINEEIKELERQRRLSGKESNGSRSSRKRKLIKGGTSAETAGGKDVDENNNGAPNRFTYFAASGLSDDRWLCPICLDIFEDAVETPCCHNLFCEQCIKRTPTCPLCNLRINHLEGLKPNIPIRRLVMELSVPCPNDSCDDIIRKGEMEKHTKVCPFTLLPCPHNTGEELLGDGPCGLILRRDIEKHVLEECPFRMIECLLQCGASLPLNEIEEHISQECPKAIVACKNKCGIQIEKCQIERHINNDCPQEIVDCPNKGESLFEEGCQIRLKRKEMDSHKLTCFYRRVYCPNQKCAAVIIYRDLPSHDERCLYKIVDCENKCGERIQRQHLDRHKEQCEYQQVKCPYYELGCKNEILRKQYIDHLKDESFKHSIFFIEGQKKKNREIDELKNELMSMRQNYDVEIQAMFMELNRVKEDVVVIKNKTGIHTTHHQFGNQVKNGQANGDIISGPKMILGGNSGLSPNIVQVKRDERRYGELQARSSAGSSFGGLNENLPSNIYRGLEQRGFIMSGSQSQNNQAQYPGQPVFKMNSSQAQNQRPTTANRQLQAVNDSNNSGSLGSLMQSIGNASSFINNNVISSQQYSLGPTAMLNLGQQNPFIGPSGTQNIQVRPPPTQPATLFASSFIPNNTDNASYLANFRLGNQDLMLINDSSNNQNQGTSRNTQQTTAGATQNFIFNSSTNNQQPTQAFNMFGTTQSAAANGAQNRARISMLGSQTSSQFNNMPRQGNFTSNVGNNNITNNEQRPNQYALFLGSMDSSELNNNNGPQQQANKPNSPTGSSLDFWRISQSNNGGGNQGSRSSNNASGAHIDQQQRLFQQNEASKKAQQRPPNFRRTAAVTASFNQSNQQQNSNSQIPHSSSLQLHTNSRQQQQQNSGSKSQAIPRTSTNQNNVVAESAADDLDSSNVLYDDDFEIEEENKNNF